MASKVISTILNLKDNFSKTLEGTTQTTKRFQNELKHTQNSINDMKKNVVGGFGSIAKGALTLAGGVGFIEIAKQSVELASSLTEVQNVVDVTFGKGAQQINSWSKTALNSFGLSELQAKKFTGTLGALMKSSGLSGDHIVTMSEKMAGLSADFASFYNLPIEEAFEKIKSGISGETEPLKALGINMSVANMQAYALSQGITKNWNSMSQAEQTQLRYNYLMKVSSDAQGDFARTNQGFANQLRLAKVNLQQMGASIGAQVLPFLNKLLLSFNSGGMKNIGAVFSNAFSSIGNVINSIKPNLESLWNSIEKFAQVSGITEKIKGLFSGANTKQLDTAKEVLKDLLDGVKVFVDFCTTHVGLVKASFAGLVAGIGAVKIVNEFLKIQDSVNKASKAVKALEEGASATKKIGTVFQSIFKLPVGALGFIAVVALIAGLAYIIIKNWDPIKEFFKKLWSGITGEFEKVKNSVVNNWNYVKNSVVNIVKGLGTSISTIWTNIKTGISGAFNSIKTTSIAIWNGIKASIGNLVDTLVRFVVTKFDWLIIGISNIFKGLKTILGGIFNVIKTVVLGPILLVIDLIRGIFTGNFSKLISDTKAIFNKLKVAFGQIWAGIKLVFVSSLDIIKGYLMTVWYGITTGAKIAWNGLKTFFSNLWTGIKILAVSAWEGLKNGVITISQNIWQGIVFVFTSVVNFFRNLPTTLYNLGIAIFTGLKNGAWSIVSGIGTWITEKFDAALEFFRNLPSKTLEFGKNFIQGFIDGVGNMIDAVINKVKSVGESIEKKIREVLGIHSPSVVMQSIGGFVVQGLANGIDKSKHLLTNVTTKIGKGLPQEFYGWGQDIPGSLSDGIAANVKITTDTITDMANNIRKLIHFTKPDEGPLKDSDTYGPDMVKGLSIGIQNNIPLTTNSTIAMATNIRNVITQLIKDSVGYGQQIVSSLGQGVQESISGLTDIVRSLTDKVVAAFREGFGIHSPSRVMHEMGGYLMQGLINGMTSNNVQDFISKQIGSIVDVAGGAIGGNVSAWLSTALALTGTDMGWLPGLLKLTSYESGDPGTLGSGNSTLVNNISVGGEYATGLLQMLPSTFKEFMQSGMNNIMNPIDNAVAAIRYIKTRYGSVYNTPLFRGGSYMGYASGTDNAKNGVAEVAEEGMELVIGRQARRFKGGEQVLNNRDTIKLLKGKGNKNINVYLIIKGNVIGNEDFINETGAAITDKIITAINNAK